MHTKSDIYLDQFHGTECAVKCVKIEGSTTAEGAKNAAYDEFIRERNPMVTPPQNQKYLKATIILDNGTDKWVVIVLEKPSKSPTQAFLKNNDS